MRRSSPSWVGEDAVVEALNGSQSRYGAIMLVLIKFWRLGSIGHMTIESALNGRAASAPMCADERECLAAFSFQLRRTRKPLSNSFDVYWCPIGTGTGYGDILLSPSSESSEFRYPERQTVVENWLITRGRPNFPGS